MAASYETSYDENNPERWALYSILMIDREATEDEINSAYKRLSLQFHPDKHIAPDSKKAAENIFHRIKRARDVLCDPHLRRIYDAVGPEGLQEFENSQLIRKDMRSSEEVVEEYQRLLEIKRFQDEINSYNPHAKTAIHIDMCPVFETNYFGEDPDDDVTIFDQLVSIDVTKMELGQGFKFPVGTENYVSIDSSLSANYESGRRATGCISFGWRRLLPYGVVGNAGLVIGHNNNLSCSFSRSMSKYSLLSIGIDSNVYNGRLFPSYAGSLSYQISRKLKVEMSARAGIFESVKFSLNYTSETYSINVAVQTGVELGAPGSPSPNSVSALCVKHFPNQNVKVKLGGELSLSKYMLILGFTKKIPDRQLMFNSTLKVNSKTGVYLILRGERGRQKCELPILMSSFVDVAAIGYAAIIPLTVYAAIHSLLIFPYLKQQQEQRLQKRKEEQKKRLDARREAAILEVNLMTSAAEQSIESEQRVQGLVIVKALYGRLQTMQQSDTAEDVVINVTVPLQHQVKNSSLKIAGIISKAEMPGFYDPCYGEEKSLYIRYKFHNALHHVTIADNEPIHIPLQAHLMTSGVTS